MAVTCSEIGALGSTLATQGDEVSQRSGVSRLFYAAMHRSDEWATSRPGVASPGPAQGTHKQIEHKLRNLDPQCDAAMKLKGRVLAAKLNALKVRRVLADYELSATLKSSEVAAQKAETDKLFADCAVTP
jgi:hypothetical protein